MGSPNLEVFKMQLDKEAVTRSKAGDIHAWATFWSSNLQKSFTQHFLKTWKIPTNCEENSLPGLLDALALEQTCHG